MESEQAKFYGSPVDLTYIYQVGRGRFFFFKFSPFLL